jgi:glutathione S-transferase
MSRPAHRLVTLVFSHYNEKARWALDYCGIDYEERGFLPGFSQLGVMIATRGRGGAADKVSTRWSTPVLITRDGKTLCDSTDIARWASSAIGGGGPGPLFPEPAVLDLVDALGRELGPYSRRLAYWHAFQSKTAMRTLAERNVSRRQALAFRVVAPVGLGLVKNRLGVDDAGARRALERVRAQLAIAEQRLARGPYLVGDGFTAADLTFASLIAPILLVSRDEGYGATLPEVEELGPEARALITEARATRAGAFAIEVFRRHRRQRHAAAPPPS